MNDLDTRVAALLPCPFCGGEAVFESMKDMDDPDCGGEFIVCKNIACHACSMMIFPTMEDAKPFLVEKWNTRAELQKPAKQEESKGFPEPTLHSEVIRLLQAKVVELEKALQKPALHEPVRDRASIESSCRFIEQHIATRKCDHPAVSDCWRCNSVYLAKRMRDLLTSCNPQGRAQPAQTELTDAEIDAWKCARCNGDGWHWESVQVAERKSDQQEVKMDCRECEGVGYMGPDAIRASKGEKT